MIPLRLQLRNFLSYRDDVPPLFFDGFKLACLSGLNGHGKSALLDAMTWALWGKARTSRDDELIHKGRTELEVQFDFQLGPNVYRVIRKRQLLGGSGQRSVLALDFQVRDGDRFRSIAGDSASDTQKEIVRRLRLDYETFVNSAFILQGKADSFTTKPPGERKRLLGELLGLAKYDELAESAREQARAYAAEVQRLEGEIAALERDLAQRAELEAKHAAAGAAAAAAEAKRRAADDELERLRERARRLELKGREAAALRQRVERARQRLAEDERRLDALGAAIARAEALLAARDALAQQLAQRDALRQQLEELDRRKDQRAALESQASALRLAIERAKSALESERARQDERVRTLRKKAAQRDELSAALARSEQQLHQLTEAEAERERLRQVLTDLLAQQERLKAENKRLAEDAEALKQKQALLASAEAACPTCGGPLSLEQRDRLLADVETELEVRRQTYRENQETVKRLAAESATVQETLAEGKRQADELAKLRERLGAVRDRLDEAERAATELPAAEAALADVERRLAEGQYAVEERTRLAALEAELTTLPYDPAVHQRVRDELAALAELDRQWAELERAEATLAENRQEHQALAVRLVEDRAQIEQDTAHLRDLEAEAGELPQVRQQIQQQERHCEDLAKDAREARDRLASTRQMLDYLTRQEQVLAAQRSAYRRAAEERSLYAELDEAFGRRGVQAMLIEQVLPELEDEANRLLARLSEGQMFVRFETQRAARSRDGTIETLDIRIADEAGMRPYELYSGGEAFRINFAIRIALSKLLARRAGAQVQMLVIDEGFGTQDERGCERLVEAINAISDDFERVLVITHVERLKDVFPVRIEVTKTPETGSQFVVI